MPGVGLAQARPNYYFLYNKEHAVERGLVRRECSSARGPLPLAGPRRCRYSLYGFAGRAASRLPQQHQSVDGLGRLPEPHCDGHHYPWPGVADCRCR